MTQGVLNTVEQPKQETQPVKWNGTHIKFDDDGNTEVIMKTEQPVQKEEEVATDSKTQDVEVEEEEQPESFTDEWEYREPEKVQWCGTHTIFKDDDNDAEEEKEEVMGVSIF